MAQGVLGREGKRREKPRIGSSKTYLLTQFGNDKRREEDPRNRIIYDGAMHGDSDLKKDTERAGPGWRRLTTGDVVQLKSGIREVVVDPDAPNGLAYAPPKVPKVIGKEVAKVWDVFAVISKETDKPVRYTNKPNQPIKEVDRDSKTGEFLAEITDNGKLLVKFRGDNEWKEFDTEKYEIRMTSNTIIKPIDIVVKKKG